MGQKKKIRTKSRTKNPTITQIKKSKTKIKKINRKINRTRGYRGLQRVTRGYKGLQGVTGGNKGLQGVTYRLTHSASELSGFTCTSSLTMNEKFQ